MTFNPNDLSTYKVTKLPTFTKEDFLQSEVDEIVGYYQDKGGYNIDREFIKTQVEREIFGIHTNNQTTDNYWTNEPH